MWPPVPGCKLKYRTVRTDIAREAPTNCSDGPVQLVLDTRHQIVAVSEGEEEARDQDVPEA